MSHFFFSSMLKIEYQEDLEQLFYFNTNQARTESVIVRSIELLGNPKIIRCGETLRISIGGKDNSESLFAFEGCFLSPRLVGVVVYVRKPLDCLTIAHLAVGSDYVLSKKQSDAPLAIQLFTQVMKIAHQIKGIEAVSVLYTKGARRISLCRDK